MPALFKQKMASIGFGLILLLSVTAFAGPLLSPYDFADQNLRIARQGPTYDHWLGTDKFGRDVLTRVLYGGRISLFVGVISQGVALLIGVPLGCLAGYYRGWVDSVVMWTINVFWSFPYLLLVLALNIALTGAFRLALLGLFERTGLDRLTFVLIEPEAMADIITVFIALGLVSWVLVARIVRGQILSAKESAYVEAARAFGFSTPRILMRHLLPNIVTPIFVVVTLGFAEAIIAEAALSFLGLGVQPPTPSWGRMISDNYGLIFSRTGWCSAVAPGVAIGLAVLGLNLLGDGLRDFLDPHLKDELEARGGA
ncbi:MAG: ABC transporter permease subunit [bacterium]|nr:ABC transporter permease subunit [bacterium]